MIEHPDVHAASAPLHVLVAHNAYQQLGGEDRVVDAEIELLRRNGHRVTEYRRHNDELRHIGKLSALGDTFWSRRTVADIDALLRDGDIDIVHAHNTFPLISPSLYWAAAARGVPVVQTLHNFRLFCPQAMFLRESKVCEDCIGRLPLPAIRHACYRESRVQTSALVGMLGLHRAIGTWSDKVTRYIALNDFCRNKFIEGGLPAEKVVVKPNFVAFDPPPAGDRAGLLFVGRLSPEKGVTTLLKAAPDLPSGSIRVAGDGPLSAEVAGTSCVTRLGSLTEEGVREQMYRSQALVLPSIWYENFPRTLVEAFACGLPVVASRIGALAELVEDGCTGLLFEPGDDRDLARKLAWLLAHPDEAAGMGRQARLKYESSYAPAANIRQLVAVYADARSAMPR